MKKLLFLFMLSLLMVGMVGGQVTIHSNACASATTGWTYTNGGGLDVQQGGYWLVDNSGDAIISEAFDVTGYIDLTLDFRVATYGSGTNHPAKVEYSTDNGSTWSSTTFTSETPTSTTYINSGTWNIGTINSSQFKLKWTHPTGNLKGVRIDDILFKGTVIDTTPTISVSSSSLTGFTYVLGNGPSSEKTFTVSGSNLSEDISITPPSNYEISTGTGLSFSASTSIALTQSNGSVGETTIYIRLEAGLGVGTFNGEEITLTSAGADNKTVTCSGSVTAPPASAQVLLRPTQISIGDASHESAILMKVDNYASDDYRYRLYNGSNQYRPWDAGSDNWISNTSYSSGPQIPGTPSSSVTWWIPFQRGNNASTSATYKDRQGTAYNTDNKTVALPSATAITTPVSIQKSAVAFSTWSDYSARHIVLAYNSESDGTLIAAASTAPTTGDFTVYVENGTIIRRIEIRDVMNTLLEAVTGTWPEPDPSVVLSTGALEGFHYYDGNGPSGEKSFTVSGAHLDGNITITPPTNYEISTVSGEGFIATNLITVTETDGSASATIHVRLKAGLDVGTHNQIITVSSTGTADQSVTCSGMVHKSVPSYHVSDFTVDTGTLSWSAIDMIWWDPTSGTIPDAYLIKGSTIGYGDISAPVNGVPEANSALVQNVGAGVENHSFAELLAETTYYFKIFPYTNSGEFIQYKTDGVVPEESATTGSEPITFAYWNFNSPPTSGNWPQPIASDPGTGAITYSFANAVSFGGTTVNGMDAEVNGGSFVPQGGTGNVNNGKYFEIATSTEGYGGIALSYATQRTTTGFTSQAIYYSTDGETYTLKEIITDIPSSWAVRTFDFSEIDGTANNPYFKVRVMLNGATDASGNNRFDNIRISGSALYDYPEDTEIEAGEVLIKISGGSGLIVTRELTPVPNPSFVTTFEQAIELTGDGPWIVTVYSLDDWVACLFDGEWSLGEVDGTGYSNFWLELPEGKSTVIELKSGNGGNPTLPVELSTFTVLMNGYNHAVLTWVTQTETGVSGFYVYRNNTEDLATAEMVSNLIPATNTSQQQVYLFTDKELGGPGTYYYWLQVSDMDGSDSFYGPITLVYQGGNEPGIPSIPQVTELKSIYPNPFNPSTTISYGLAEAADVKVQIFNSRGQLVRSISEGQRNAGNYNLIWNGTDNNGQSQPTGVYFVRLHAGKKVFNSKAVLMK